MSKHTQGRLEVRLNGAENPAELHCGRHVIAEVWGTGSDSVETKEANAERLAAAWNQMMERDRGTAEQRAVAPAAAATPAAGVRADGKLVTRLGALNPPRGLERLPSGFGGGQPYRRAEAPASESDEASLASLPPEVQLRLLSLNARIEGVEQQLRHKGLRMEADLASVDGEQGDAIIDLVTGEHHDDPESDVIELATEWTQLARERSVLLHEHQPAKAHVQGQPTAAPTSPTHASLAEALKRVAGALRQLESMLHCKPWIREAAEMGLALRMLAYGVVEGNGLAPGEVQADADRLIQMKGVSDLIAPIGGNGIVDAVIWPACRVAGYNRLAEDISRTTNDLRAARYALLEEERQRQNDELTALRERMESLRRVATSMYFALNDASSVVDTDDGGQYAYQRELEGGARELGIDREAGSQVHRDRQRA